jgi:hypothetical protein
MSMLQNSKSVVVPWELVPMESASPHSKEEKQKMRKEFQGHLEAGAGRGTLKWVEEFPGDFAVGAGRGALKCVAPSTPKVQFSPNTNCYREQSCYPVTAQDRFLCCYLISWSS